MGSRKSDHVCLCVGGVMGSGKSDGVSVCVCVWGGGDGQQEV